MISVFEIEQRLVRISQKEKQGWYENIWELMERGWPGLQGWSSQHL
jgi:hypothetical protein